MASQFLIRMCENDYTLKKSHLKKFHTFVHIMAISTHILHIHCRITI